MKKRKNLHAKIFHLFVIFSYYRAPYFHAILITGTTEKRLSLNEARLYLCRGIFKNFSF